MQYTISQYKELCMKPKKIVTTNCGLRPTSLSLSSPSVSQIGPVQRGGRLEEHCDLKAPLQRQARKARRCDREMQSSKMRKLKLLITDWC